MAAPYLQNRFRGIYFSVAEPALWRFSTDVLQRLPLKSDRSGRSIENAVTRPQVGNICGIAAAETRRHRRHWQTVSVAGRVQGWPEICPPSLGSLQIEQMFV
jgi:hypothetical protein